MKAKITIAVLFLCIICQGLFAQRPLVYNKENTGESCARPPLPSFDQLPVIQPLTDPFMWSNNLSRSTNFNDWECRRNEIKAEIENYEIGTKPPRPDSITASYANGTLTVNVTKNGQTLVLTSQVSLPAGAGPFPAVIGMNSLSGSVPANIFTSRNIARITFNHNQVTTYGGPALTNPYFRLYPDQNLSNSGQYAGWAWGVSRIIDGLELVQASLPIDLKHIGVTGCSYAGKMALFAGAYDERVALTIAQESGGGGAPAWRVSETIGAVENLGATDYNWFRDDMRQFANVNVPKLPHDHHELMAMVAPRALLVTGNTDYEWLANPSAYVSARAAHEVWKTFGIGDRFGFYIDGAHAHCAVPTTQIPAMEAFVQKFLVGDTTVNTNITVNPYPQMDYQKWYQWWGSGIPVLPVEPPGIQKYLEAECGIVGSNWNVLSDTAASGGKYVVVTGLNSPTTAPAGAAAAVVLSFTIDSAASYNINARLNAPTADDDSYYIKVDSGAFVSVNGLGTTGWGWVRLSTATLSVGTHTLTIAYREDGAKLDKVLITTSNATFSGKGPLGTNCAVSTVCPPNITINTSSCTTPVAIRWTEPSDSYPASINISSTSVLWYKGSLNGHGYYESSNQATWEAARTAVNSVGAHLLTIGNAAEKDFVFTNLNQSNSAGWIGLYNTGTKGNFAWVTGEPVTYTNWIPGQPDNLYGMNNTDTRIFEPYVYINGWVDSLNRWNDASSTATARFLAEFDNTTYSYRQISGPANGSTRLPGVYTICYERTTNAGNLKDTCCFTVTVTCNTAMVGNTVSEASITDISNRLQVTAFPNPSKDYFRLRLSGSNSAEKISMQVSDITGRIIENRTGLSTNQVLNFGASLKSGVYFVQVTQGTSKNIVKVIKE